MYPYDAPATEISGYWSDGTYTPHNTLAYIKDDKVPINKNAMVNSVGKNLSLMQTFVNSSYLGRSGTYIQNSYTNYTHIGHLISSGYIDADNPGSILLCSNLEPYENMATDIGTTSKRFGFIHSQHLAVRYISGVAGAGLALTAPGAFPIRSWKNFEPSGDYQQYLGGASNNWHTVYSSGFYGKHAKVNYLTSATYTNTANPGIIYLCSDFIPQHNNCDLGGSSSENRFANAYTTQLYLYTTDATYTAANKVWVDASGFVRIGDHFEFHDYFD